MFRGTLFGRYRKKPKSLESEKMASSVKNGSRNYCQTFCIFYTYFCFTALWYESGFILRPILCPLDHFFLDFTSPRLVPPLTSTRQLRSITKKMNLPNSDSFLSWILILINNHFLVNYFKKKLKSSLMHVTIIESTWRALTVGLIYFIVYVAVCKFVCLSIRFTPPDQTKNDRGLKFGKYTSHELI